MSSGQLITSLVPLSSPSVEYNCHNKTPFIMSTGGDTPRSFEQRLNDLLNNSANIRNNDGDLNLVDGVGGLSISSTPNPSVAISGITSIGSGGAQRRVGIDTSATAVGANPSPPSHTSPSQRGMLAGIPETLSGGDFSGTSLHFDTFGSETRRGYYDRPVPFVKLAPSDFSVKGNSGKCGYYFTKTARICVRPCLPGSDTCGTPSHTKKGKVDFDAVAPGASEVIMVSSRPDGAAAGGEMVYKIPLIDVEHIADEDLPLFDENYKSAGGCELILRAKAKYEASQIEEDEELGYEGFKAINRLGEWSPTEYESVPKPEFTSHVDKDVAEDIAGVIVEHEKVMESNAAHISTIMQALPVVGTEAVDHLSPKVDEVVVKLNSLHVDFDIMLEEVGRKSEIATI